ncbi:hypothetical protein AC229_1294 [Oenococcus oeni]|nr:hypothetical protein AC229_1294 [Oenococcus oeni]
MHKIRKISLFVIFILLIFVGYKYFIVCYLYLTDFCWLQIFKPFRSIKKNKHKYRR